MLRVAIDTNALVSALRSRRGASFRLISLLGDARWRVFEENRSMAMSRTISLPEEILRQAEEFAAREHVSVEEFVSAALSEQFAGVAYLRHRKARASIERFRAALDQIPDIEPEARDRLE
jgi:predicted nucleic acid-binding protein